MKNIKFYLLLLILIIGSQSCSDHNIDEQKCKYVGMNSYFEFMSNRYLERETYDSKYILNESGMPLELSSIRNRTSTDSTLNKQLTSSSEEIKYSYTYNETGFLIQTIRTNNKQYKGVGYLSDNYGTLVNAKIEVVETTDFKYELGLIKTAITKITTTVLSDNWSPIYSFSGSSKDYEYLNGVAVAATEVFTNGEKITSKFVNGLISFEIKSGIPGIIYSNSYDERGRVTLSTVRGIDYEMTYDEKDNLRTIKTFINKKLTYREDLGYDDRVNPETQIVIKFKGIPEPISRLKAIDGTNNLTSSKFFNIAEDKIFASKTSYTYNSVGLPISAVLENNGLKTFTDYIYECE